MRWFITEATVIMILNGRSLCFCLYLPQSNAHIWLCLIYIKHSQYQSTVHTKVHPSLIALVKEAPVHVPKPIRCIIFLLRVFFFFFFFFSFYSRCEYVNRKEQKKKQLSCAAHHESRSDLIWEEKRKKKQSNSSIERVKNRELRKISTTLVLSVHVSLNMLLCAVCTWFFLFFFSASILTVTTTTTCR